MNARHLPSDETLAGFAAGRLDEGMSLVVAAHVEMNSASARALREIEAVGGGVLAAGEAVPMLTSAEDALARLEREDHDEPPALRPVETGLPRVLQPYELGRWQPIGLGVSLRRVKVPGAESRVFMLRAAPGTRLPEHRHTGHEWTTILSAPMSMNMAGSPAVISTRRTRTTSTIRVSMPWKGAPASSR